MIGRKVLSVTTHIASIIAKNTIDFKVQGADMIVTPVGVLVKSIKSTDVLKGSELLLPWANITQVKLAPEGDDDQPKRGRPAKKTSSPTLAA